MESLVLDDPTEGIGLNNRVHLATVDRVMRNRINERWMLAGVTLVDPQTTTIEANVKIGMDTIIYPNTYLRGNTTIGEDCEIGPDTDHMARRLGTRLD